MSARTPYTPPCVACGTRSRAKALRRRSCPYCNAMVCDACWPDAHRIVLNSACGVTLCVPGDKDVVAAARQRLAAEHRR